MSPTRSRRSNPTISSIQLGFEFKLEQGTLVAVLVRGSTTANVTVNLQWDKAPAPGK